MKYLLIATMLFMSCPVEAATTSVTIAASSAAGASAASAARSAQARRDERNSAHVSSCSNPDETYVVFCDAKYIKEFEEEVPGMNPVFGHYNGCRSVADGRMSIEEYFLLAVPEGDYSISSYFDSYNTDWVITGCKVEAK